MLSARKSLSIFALSLFLLPAVTQAQHYKQTNLVSDVQGTAPVMDPNLKNPWGLTRSSTTPTRPGSPFWIGNNNSGTSSLYGGTGNAINIFTEAGGVPGNFVIVPPPGLLPARSPLPRASSLTAAPLIFYSTKVCPLACRPRSSSPRKMALSPAGTRAPTSPRVPRRLPSTLSSKSTIQKKAVPTAPSTKAQPPEKSIATNFFTSRTSVLRESKFITPRSSA